MFGLGGAESSIIVLLVVFISLVPVIITIWALIDVLKNEFTGSNKIIWALIVLLIPPPGAILYYFIGTKQKIRTEAVSA